MSVILILLGILAYLIAAGIAFGYVASHHTKVDTYGYSGKGDRDPENFKEAAREPEPWAGAIFWPITLVIFCISGPLARIARFSWDKSEKSKERNKMRIKLEEKIRIAQETAEKEAEQEIEEMLTQNKKRILFA